MDQDRECALSPATPTPGPRRLRPILRWLALILFGSLAFFTMPLAFARTLPASISPFVMLSCAIALRAFSIASLFAAPILLWTIFRQRAFCRYLCPTGLLIDVAGKAHRLAADATRAACAGTVANPPSASAALPSGSRLNVTLAQYLLLLTLGGAILGWPIVLWLDPLAIFSSFFGLFHRPLTLASILSSSLLPIVLILSLFAPKLWCPKICPLGAMQDILSILRRRILSHARPAETEPNTNSRPTAPIPIGAARPRRWLLATGLGCVGAFLLRKAVPIQPRVLRPPGARPEPAFTELCIRCGQCTRACPTQILHADLGQQGVAGLLAPVLRISDQYCREDCSLCGQVCPSGAIRPFAPAEKPRTRIGLPLLSRNDCLRIADKECSACVSACPYQAIRLVFDSKDYTSLPAVTSNQCNGCGACQVACPASPKALMVRPII